MRRPEPRRRRGQGLSTRLASGLTRRSFLGRMGGALLALTGGSAVAAACGRRRAKRSTSADTSGRRVPARVLSESRGSIAMASRCARATGGRSTTSAGWSTARAMRSTRTVTASSGPTARPLPAAPRTRLCEEWVRERYGHTDAVTQGSWYRCCGGQVRKLVDCCSVSRLRINGDASLVGYCWNGKRVFCVMYYDSGLAC